jgi:hypothetical protein
MNPSEILDQFENISVRFNQLMNRGTKTVILPYLELQNIDQQRYRTCTKSTYELF